MTKPNVIEVERRAKFGPGLPEVGVRRSGPMDDQDGAREDGVTHERVAVVLAAARDEFEAASIDVVRADGTLVARLNVTSKPGRADIDVIAPAGVVPTALAWKDGREVLRHRAAGSALIAVDLRPAEKGAPHRPVAKGART